MTKSTITREQLLEIIETDHVQCGEASYLARMALAAMDGEPVAWLLSGGGTKNVVCFDSGNAYADPLREVTPLYRHAQPALVIPDEMTAEQAYEIGYYYGDPVNVFARGANWMRQHIIDSTLAAAQHDTPALNLVRNVVTVPGKWIPVSERMPEEGGRYWCYVEEQNSLGKSHYQWNCSWNGDVWSDKALTGRVTHWMPLPAAPQEAINALISVVSRNEPEGK
ncbi:hypothetical protein CW753_14660 [Klebsiella pneumoniae]|nr:hypothetical protein CW753_14660 [Klebsiella pneumoniae]